MADFLIYGKALCHVYGHVYHHGNQINKFHYLVIVKTGGSLEKSKGLNNNKPSRWTLRQ